MTPRQVSVLLLIAVIAAVGAAFAATALHHRHVVDHYTCQDVGSC